MARGHPARDNMVRGNMVRDNMVRGNMVRDHRVKCHMVRGRSKRALNITKAIVISISLEGEKKIAGREG